MRSNYGAKQEYRRIEENSDGAQADAAEETGKGCEVFQAPFDQICNVKIFCRRINSDIIFLEKNDYFGVI